MLARQFIDAQIATGWASCAITQNGFVRVISRPRYPSPVAPSVAIDRAVPTEAVRGATAANLLTL